MVLAVGLLELPCTNPTVATFGTFTPRLIASCCCIRSCTLAASGYGSFILDRLREFQVFGPVQALEKVFTEYQSTVFSKAEAASDAARVTLANTTSSTITRFC